MKNIWNEAQEKVHNGSTFRINLEKRDLVIDGKRIIKDGKYEGELGCKIELPVDILLATIEEYYGQYLHSVPSARSEAKHKRYFRAFPEHELSEEDMLYGQHRDITQLRLELFVLMAILQNALVWDEFAKGKWFWQSKRHPSLVLLRQWIEINNQS